MAGSRAPPISRPIEYAIANSDLCLFFGLWAESQDFLQSVMLTLRKSDHGLRYPSIGEVEVISIRAGSESRLSP